MKNKYIYLTLLAVGVTLTGCATVEEPKNEPPVAVVNNELQEELKKADNQYKRGDWQGAFIAYSDIQERCDDITMYRKLQIKISNSLYKMNNYPAALAALAPMPNLPGTLNDCQKLAMAAQILMAMKSNMEYVEALWEVALDNTVDEEGSVAFKADGYARLGKIYFEREKNAHAIKCFQYAAELYNILGDSENEKNCINIMEYLR